ncbi:MAG: archaetidylserine decarboxylase [Gammaproteobacteria bacterium]|nr:archaetidylserine decarboxylase [Gammaproteobacteria bacterium]
MPNNFNVFLQYCCPKHLASRFVGVLANCRWIWFKNWAIKRLIRKHHIDVSEAISDRLTDYPSFNHFFTRHLKPELRPIAKGENTIVSPVDGTVSQSGKIEKGVIFQAKNFFFSVETLLGGSSERANRFQQGSFTTFYLAPRNYHRVHIPMTGTLRKTIYIPGSLFSVNPLTTMSVPNLFARNERLVCLFDTVAGEMAVILVGAMLVGKMKTVWCDTYDTKKISTHTFSEKIILQKGDELGHFEMGSTVIVLFSNPHIQWDKNIIAECDVKIGESVAVFNEI